jgi:hypothetical protein
MVILYAARHRLPVPGLARWLLALGIVATLAANVAHGWSDGPVGAVVAAWPAASLVGSYELLLWLIRTSAACVMTRDDVPCQVGEPAHHPVADLQLAQVGGPALVPCSSAPCGAGAGVLESRCIADPTPSRANGPERAEVDHAYQPTDQQMADWPGAEDPHPVGQSEDEVNLAAVVAYQASLAAVGRCRSASWPRCTERPPDAGPATAWQRLTQAPLTAYARD